MEKTIEQQIVAEFATRIQNQVSSHAEAIVEHVLPTDEYARHVGAIYGLRFALAELEAVREMFLPQD